jgi:hypothetical protein
MLIIQYIDNLILRLGMVICMMERTFGALVQVVQQAAPLWSVSNFGLIEDSKFNFGEFWEDKRLVGIGIRVSRYNSLEMRLEGFRGHFFCFDIIK